MNAFNAHLKKLLKARKEQHLLRQLSTFERREGPYIWQNGKKFINFSSNDYLNLSQHPALLKGAVQFAETYGVGSTSSRLVTGNQECFEAVEKKLAKCCRHPAALIFPSGFQANSTIIATLLQAYGKDVQVFTDRHIHASLHAGCQMAQCKQKRFKHNNLKHLSDLLEKASADIPKIIISETLFSMDGDRPDFNALQKLAKAHKALLIVDCAHDFGITPPPQADVLLGTFGKACGVGGAFVAASQDIIDYLITACPGLIYSTALSPLVLGAIDASLSLIAKLNQEKQYLKDNSSRYIKALKELGFNTGQAQAHIIPIIVGSAEKALHLATKLKENGVLAVAIRAPTVPPGTSRVRLSLTSVHNQEHLQHLLGVLEQL